MGCCCFKKGEENAELLQDELHEADFSKEKHETRVMPPKMPLMVPPEMADLKSTRECMKCASRFTMIRHQYPCRACGEVFCELCAPHKTDFPQFGYHRLGPACDNCFKRENRRFLFYERQLPLLEHGEPLLMVKMDILRKAGLKKNLKMRHVCYSEDSAHLQWYGTTPDKRTGQIPLKGEVPLEKVIRISKGKGSGILKDRDYIDERKAFSIKTEERTIDFVAEVQAMRDRWVESLENLVEFTIPPNPSRTKPPKRLQSLDSFSSNSQF
eukprot:gb/GEZN01014486.1/.p1 GENE.gb/GEZN01014486.1/~~gb/GEZN01014486.1/.p1  ORF type:complete len:276 (+),score=31.08 gb/GEZN01014486.1/:24-830(+)